jgi:NAD(P)-dependent dehydrogenase (short-subunit alcohol dehydrogenase family)
VEDKVALVTGASSGIGFDLAKELANRGYDVAIASAGERLSGAAEEPLLTGTLGLTHSHKSVCGIQVDEVP